MDVVAANWIRPLRYVTGETFFPVTIWCDNKAAGNCTKRNCSHKLKDFDKDVSDICQNLQTREKLGKRKHMADTRGDCIKSCIDQGRICVKWISKKENMADIMTKPLPANTLSLIHISEPTRPY